MNQEDSAKAGLAALNLLEEFKPHTYQEWRAAAQELLKDKPFDKAMKTPTNEGITLEAMYRREDIASLDIRRDLPGMGARVRGGDVDGFTANAWAISQELPPDARRVQQGGAERPRPRPERAEHSARLRH
jgi:methylmalonyl-CoA mutase